MDNSPSDATRAESDPAEHDKDRLDEAILREQVRYLIKAMGGPEFAAAVWFKDGGLDYLYRPGYLIARDERWREVAEVLDAGEVDVERVERGTGESLPEGRRLQDQRGLTVLKVTPRRDDISFQEVLDLVDQRLGIGIATPDHILFVTPGGKVCPATEPEELDGAPAPYPPITSDTGAGTEVFVSVVDTGWWPAAASDPVTPWLADVTGDPETIDLNHIHPYAGHGTFIAGVIRNQAPAATIRVEGFLPLGGAAYESEMVIQLSEALDQSPDIISLSAGCPTREDLPLVSFEVFWEQRLRHQKGTVLVAAAGNDATRRPFWPAAFPWAVSVGALDAAGQRADYTNYGSWVDVYALGNDLVNAFPTGTFFCHEPPNVGQERHFTSLAKWSGTSFSTPLVSGLIAARMSQHGISGRLAADQLLAEARIVGRRGVGPVLQPNN